nr:unnamed protein product [Callosobruchus chinensis]
MATAPDSYRLKLLCEVAGTRVYDERRDQSIAILRETKIKFKKVEEFLSNIDEKLRALEEQTEELKQYQQFDKMRRTLEYVIHEAQLNESKNKLAKVVEQRDKSGDMQRELKENLTKLQANIQKVTKAVKVERNVMNQLQEERDILTNDLQSLIREKAKLELIIKDFPKEIANDQKVKENAEMQLAMLVQTIAEKESQLEKMKSEYVTVKTREDRCSRELAMKEQRRSELYAKEARVSQFASKQDRDKWIQGQLETINKQLKDKQNHRGQLEADLKKDSKKVIGLKRKIEDHVGELERQKKFIDEYKESIHELKKNKNQLQTKRSELWRQENNGYQNLNTLKEDLINANSGLMRAKVSRAILNGMDSVQKVLETFASQGGQEAQVISHYHGLLADNFECQKSIYTAVEVTGGNGLFYHIVDTDVAATTILKEMYRQSLPGEVNFFSLNRLDVREQEYPQHADAVPIITQLRYEQKCDKAMQFVFGKTMICRDMAVASKLAKTARLDCVTLDGDKAESKGVLKGGYYDPSLSRLESYRNRKNIFDQHQQCRQELEHIKAAILETQSTIGSIDSEMQITESKMNKAKVTYEQTNAELKFLREELTNIESIRGPKEVSLAKCKLELEAMQNSMELLEAELHQEIRSQLSVEDQQQLEILNSDIQRLQMENKEVVTARIELEAEKNKLENLLSNNLIRKKEEVSNLLQEIDLDDKKHQLANAKADLEEVNLKIDKINQDLTTIEKKMKDISNRLKNEQNELENLKREERNTKEEIDECLRNLENLSTKQTQLDQKIAESMERIDQFGTLPAQELYSQYSNMSAKSLFKELEKANKNMKKFSHVNKKALDQFLTLNEDRKKLQKRIEDSDASYKIIEELLATLDERKVEAIYFTFKQCSKYFTEVFKKLVSKGTAKLVLRKSDGSEGDGMGSEKKLDNLTGIGIKVSFTGSDTQMEQLNQLSGGQKSIVALAMIFAIQKCDPAPFYLFDEIDQALDPDHREAVANMIHELSQEAQFITTTFRPELLEHANKFYGVKSRNKISHIECVSKEEAKDFVEDGRTYS